jgi:hypothetical protein
MEASAGSGVRLRNDESTTTRTKEETMRGESSGGELIGVIRDIRRDSG